MPEKVKIGPIVYSMTSEAVTHLDAEDDHSQRLDGASNHSRAQITISPRLVSSVAKQTAIHEVIHCVLTVSGYKPEDEEQVCRSLEGGLLGVLRDNPGFVTWLQSE